MVHPPHDDIKDALSNAMAISLAPKLRANIGLGFNKRLPTHSRFGGITS